MPCAVNNFVSIGTRDDKIIITYVSGDSYICNIGVNAVKAVEQFLNFTEKRICIINGEEVGIK